MKDLVPLLSVALLEERDVLLARQRARRIAELLGFEAQDQSRIGVAVSEIARNALTYAEGGRVEFSADLGARPGLRVRVSDRGPGMADTGALTAPTEGAGGAGLGISGTRRLMDTFELESAPGLGTVVVLGKALPPGTPAPTRAALSAIGQALAAGGGTDPLAELRLQNLELLHSLAELTLKQEETERLNRELALTNRGVVALYAELDEKAAELAGLNASLELRIDAAVAESQRVGEALRQSQKMEAVGQLTGGIAHDFNNLLQIVCGNLELLGRRLPNDERLRQVADNAMSGAKRAATLTQRLLAFSRQQPLEPKPIAANQLLVSMSELMRRTLGEAVTIETALDPDLWVVEADANQLENALLNLAVNARDAMARGGTLTISSRNDTVDRPADDAAPGDYVTIEVRDTGSGMPAEVMARVFEPFFTTKENGKGTGLGLSMVYGFVKQSGGHVRLESVPGQGTTVRLCLPRHLGPVAQPDHAPPVRAECARPGETILVVEDDAAVRSFTCDALRELGYAVIAVPDGPAAAEALDGAARIDLVLTDVVLAGAMTGRDVAEHAAIARGGTPVLFTSGYARDAISHQDRLAAKLEFLPKPFSTSALATKVRACLPA